MGVEQDFTEIKQLADKISKKNEAFSNPIRILILAIILANQQASWSQLKEKIEKIVDSGINPNTLTFHLAKLVDLAYLEKAGTIEQPVYKIVDEKVIEILAIINPTIVEEIKKKMS
jgi:DNA-binding transcriptional ArsR family regulator